MATHPRISAREAFALLARGYAYLDVRSEAEFALGHPAGAYNVPLQSDAPQGRVDNPDFLRVVRGVFTREQALIVGCHSGERSVRACAILLAAGYEQVVEQRAGYAGSRDPFGRVIDAGWRTEGLPCADTPTQDHDYESLKRRA